MPNWCENRVNIFGSKENLEKFKKECMSKSEKDWEYLDFAKVIPEPDYKTTPVAETFPEIHASFAKTEEEKQVRLKNEPTIREDAWWDWRIQNWGTKWNIDGQNVVEVDDDDELELCFDTAWSPPHLIYEAIVKKYPDLQVSWFYHEPGQHIAGYLGTEDE